MGIGSTLAVEEAEEQCREDCATQIARTAAAYVAVGDLDRHTAVKVATELVRHDQEAGSDDTGVLATERVFAPPSKAAPAHQITAIANELMEAATTAAETL